MKFNKLATLLGVLAILVMFSGPAAAYLINFDNLVPGTEIDGVNLGGVTLNSPGGTTMVVSLNPPLNYDHQVGWRSPANSVTNFGPSVSEISDDYITVIPLVLTFDVPQSGVTVTGGDRGGDEDQFTVTAYDISNNMIGAPVITPIFGGNPLHEKVMVDYFTVSLNFPGIKSVVISNAINFGIGIDNITFCEIPPAPTPSTYLLLGTGLVGLWGFGRRKTWR